MTVKEPTRAEIETLTAALERGWTMPEKPGNPLDFAVALLRATRDEPEPPRPEYDQDGALTGWRGIRLRGERVGAEPGPKLLGEASPQRRFRITRQHLAEVAQVYRESLGEGLAPTTGVARHFAVPHRTATRWVGLCRQANCGLLPPTTRGRVGIEP